MQSRYDPFILRFPSHSEICHVRTYSRRVDSMFRKFLFSILVGLVVSPASSNADLLLLDDFPTDGTPPPSWVALTGTGGQGVVGGQLVQATSGTVNTVAQGTQDYYRPLSSVVTTGVVYAGYDLNIVSAPTDAADNYFAHFSVNNLGGGGFFGRVSLNLVAGNTVLGLAESTTTGSVANVFGTTPIALSTTVRIVQSYDLGTGEARVWLNPIDETSPFLADATFTPNATGIGSFNFRINNNSDGNKLIDNLSVATTFAEALTFTAIPEPTSALLLIGAVFGLSFNRRRKQA